MTSPEVTQREIPSQVWCPRCESWKPFEAFYRNWNKPNMSQPYCIQCGREYRHTAMLDYPELNRSEKSRSFYLAVQWLIEEDEDRWKEILERAVRKILQVGDEVDA